MDRLAVDVPRGPLTALRNRPAAADRCVAVMVNGLAETKERWSPSLVRVAPAGYSAVAYDHLGQFQPARCDDFGVEALAGDLLAVIDAVSPHRPVHLVGGCFGGFVAREVAAAAPGRVRSLVLLGSGLSLASSAAPLMDREVETALAAGGMTAAFEKVRAEAERSGLGAREVRRLRESYLPIRPDFLSGLTRSVARYRSPDRIVPPVLVAHGSADQVWDAREQRALAERLGAPIAVIDGAGHSTTVSHSRATAETFTRFWDAVEARNRTRPELDTTSV